MRTGHGYMLRHDNFSSHTTLNNVLAKCSTSSIVQLCEDCVDYGSMETEDGEKRALGAVPSFAKPLLFVKLLRHSLHTKHWQA